MSDRNYVSGQDGGGDYYVAPQPQGDYNYYDPYLSSFDFYYGFGLGSPFGFGPFGYGAWWNAWPYVSPSHHDFVVVPDPQPRVTHKTRRSEFPPPDARQPGLQLPVDAAADHHERSVGPAALPRGPARVQRRGDSPIP